MKYLSERKKLKKLKRCDLAARAVLKYGYLKKLTEKEIEEFWDEENTPSVGTLNRVISAKNIKWYIRNHISIDDPIWNGDFIGGLTKAGKVSWHKKHYPTFKWWGSPILATILKDCPFHGKVKDGKSQKSEKHYYLWKKVPALYLQNDKNTLSYIAGLLATGKEYAFEGNTYALYHTSVMEELSEYGIPVVRRTEVWERPLISPFWPALFTRFMPQSCHEYWLNIKKPYLASEYAAILWLTYADHRFEKGSIPFLKSRRMVFYDFKNDRGAVKSLQRLRVEHDLINLDPLIRECIQVWHSDLKGENDEVSTD
jgi:hypothetical protein